LRAPGSARFPWDPASTYLRPPPFVTFGRQDAVEAQLTAHPLLVLGDDITTDHISPAGAIPARSDAARWLVEHGEDPADLNVYASRRGNWEVMLRGLFTNKAAVNHLSPGHAAGQSVFAPTGEVMPVWRAAARYAEERLPVVIIAGERYGTGSSRDWAAKGAQLLGVRAVLANSFERIHRSNLIGMGVLPLRLPEGWRFDSLGLEAGDRIEFAPGAAVLDVRAPVPVVLRRRDGGTRHGTALALLDTVREVGLIRAGGIIPTILRRALKAEVPGMADKKDP
jgi:aconitate hydratase